MAKDGTDALKRVRASLACVSCNSRKTACDLSAVNPCTKCVAAGRDCVLFQSKRGKYLRKVSGTSAVKQDDRVASTSRASINLPTNQVETTTTSSSRPVLPSSLPHMSAPSILDAVSKSDQYLPSGVPPSALPVVAEVPNAGWVDLMTSSQHQQISTSSVVFASELFTLSHILKESWKRRDGHDGKSSIPNDRMHFNSETASMPGTSLSLDQLHFLSSTGCFTLPSPPVLDALFSAYFETFHPIYPVVDRKAFLESCASGNAYSGGVSLLLIWGILYVASTFGSEASLKEAGLHTRFEALQTFYQRGHALYSCSFEKDPTVVVQYLFLLSNIWSGVEDSYHWSSRASSHAMSIGMHRSAASSQLTMGAQRMWRRIWHCVYIRDRHSAAATGRPYRIIDQFCDTPLPSESDFEDDEDCDLFLFSVRLAQILGEVVDIRLGVGVADIDGRSADCYSRLLMWQSSLPPKLRYSGTFSGNVFVSFLHISYHCWVIHLYRPSSTAHSANPICSEASASATRHFEDLLQHGMILRCPQFAITALFAAMAASIFDRKFEHAAVRRLGAHRLAILTLVAKELSKARPVASWFRRMFSTLSDSTQTPANDLESTLLSGHQTNPLNLLAASAASTSFLNSCTSYPIAAEPPDTFVTRFSGPEMARLDDTDFLAIFGDFDDGMDGISTDGHHWASGNVPGSTGSLGLGPWGPW